MSISKFTTYANSRGKFLNMNLYLHVEVSVRELDSKLLLATLAASRGHNVIVSDLSGIIRGLRFNVLPPGIFHTKSLAPTYNRLKLHKNLINKGFKITSIDEEGCLAEYGYSTFANIRYSKKTVEQASAIFGWGPEDTDTLKQIYSDSSKKIYKTGSPRVDLWKQTFSDYWKLKSSAIKKPFLLVSSSFSHANNVRPLHERIKVFVDAGYYARAPELLEKYFHRASEDYINTSAFVEAIKHLAKNNIGYDIVVRPHPTEYLEAWKTYLKDISNVHIIREDSITLWVKNAFAVMHHDCTTAIEAIICKTPVVTYSPHEMKNSKKLANELGYKVNSPSELLSRVNELYKLINNNNKTEIKKKLPDAVSKKIYIDEELAAKKMMNVWEEITDSNFTKFNNLIKFKLILRLLNFKEKIFKLFNMNNSRPDRLSPKFDQLDINDVRDRILKFKNILGIKEEIECSLISDKTIFIKKR